MPNLDSPYMDARLMPRPDDARRTDIWVICNTKSGAALGAVRRHAPWRQYCFFPNGESLYSVGCMQDLCRFIAAANANRAAMSAARARRMEAEHATH